MSELKKDKTVPERVATLIAQLEREPEVDPEVIRPVITDLIDSSHFSDLGLALLAAASRQTETCEAEVLRLIKAGAHSQLIDSAPASSKPARRKEWQDTLEHLITTAPTLSVWDELSRRATFSAFSADDPTAALYLAMRYEADSVLFIMAAECEEDINKPAKLNNEGGLTPLEYALERSTEDCALAILKFDPDLELTTEPGKRPIERALYQGFWDVAERMLEDGAELPASSSLLGHAPASVVRLVQERERNRAATSADPAVATRQRQRMNL